MRLPFPFSTALLQTLPRTAKPLVDGISVPRDVRFTFEKTFMAEPIRTVFEPHQQCLAGREPNAAVETNYLAI